MVLLSRKTILDSATRRASQISDSILKDLDDSIAQSKAQVQQATAPVEFEQPEPQQQPPAFELPSVGSLMEENGFGQETTDMPGVLGADQRNDLAGVPSVAGSGASGQESVQPQGLAGFQLPSNEELVPPDLYPELYQQPVQPDQGYGSALTTLGGTPDAEAVTRPGGSGYVAPVGPDEPVTKETVTRAAATALSRAGLPVEMAPYIAGIAINEGILQPGTIARDHWSVGGVKAAGTAGTVTVPTREVRNGQSVMERGTFGTFNSMQEGMDELAKFVRDSPRFGPVAKQAAETGDYSGMIEGFRQKGYATDPNWTRQVNSIASGLTVPVVSATDGRGTGEGTRALREGFDSNAIAEQWKGLPYVFGGQGGRGRGITATDCSGFVAEVFKQSGLDLPAHTDAAYNTLKQRGQAVDPKDAQPGDVVFYMGAGTGGAITHHMGLYAGPGKVLDMSVASGGGVKERPIGHAGEYVIMRDPRLNPPVAPQRAEEAPPIQPTGVAEALGGQKIKGLPAQAALSQYGTMAMEDLNRGDSGSVQAGDSAPIAPSDEGGDYGGFDQRAGLPTADNRRSPLTRDTRGDYAPSARHGGIEPGDFELPGAVGSNAGVGIGPQVQVDQTSSTPPPGGAVEPAGVASTEAAPASSGNLPWHEQLGNTIGSAISNAINAAMGSQKPDWQQGIRDVQGRATTEPTGPLPFDQMRQDIGQAAQQSSPTERIGEAIYDSPPMQAGRAFAEGSQQEMARYLELNGRVLKGETLTPEEEQEMARAAINVVGDVGGLGNVGPRSVPGVMARPVRQAASAADNAPSAGIVSRASAAGGDEILQAGPETMQARRESLQDSDRYYHGTGSDFARPSGDTWLTDNPGTASDFAKMRGSDFNNAGPNVRAVDVPRDLNLVDMSTPEGRAVLSDAYAKAPKIAGDADYDAARYLESQGFDGIREVRRDSTRIQVFEDSLDKITNATARTPGGLVPGTAPSSAGATGVRAVGSGVGAGYQESQQEGSTPESVLQAGVGGAATSLGRSALGSRAGIRAAGSVARVAEWHPRESSDPNVKTVGEIFEREVKAPENTLPARVRIAQALTDDRAPFAKLEQEVQKAGHALSPEEKVSVITRINPDSVASQRLRDVVQPAIREARDAGVSDAALSQYIAHMHNADIAREMGDRAYDTAISRGALPSQARAYAQKVANDRNFTGGLTLKETLQALKSMENDLGPDRFRAMNDSAQKIWDHNAENLTRKYQAGLLKDDLYTELQRRYPHYVSTHILEHISADKPSAVAGGGGVSMRNTPVKALSVKGTSADRLDPLASVALNTFETERMIARNEAYQAFRELVSIDPSLSSLIITNKRGQPSASARSGLGERTITGFINGERETVALAKPLADVVERVASGSAGPVALQMFMNAYKSTLTSRNPGFALAVNPLRDFMDFIPKQAGIEADLAKGMDWTTALPRVLAAYVEQIPKVFEGILSGEFKGDVGRYLAAGGGMGTQRTDPRSMQRFAEGMARKNALEVRSPSDIKRLIGDLAKFEWSQALGDRVELIPRVAAMKLTERRGAGQLESMIAGRDATIDFQRGGWLTKQLNSMIPFLNPTVQAGAQLGRALKDHPVATIASGAATIGTSAVMAELWNNADPERAKQYADVPQYQKDGGLVFMMPWAGSDERGQRPNYVWIPLGIMSPFAMTARTAVDLGTDGKLDERSAQEMAIAALTAFSPIKGDSVTGAVTGLLPPVLSTAAELRANKDFFRNAPIATEDRDETASAFSKWAAPLLSALGDTELPLVREFSGARPSQVDYALSADTGIYGQAVKGASDIVAGRQREEDRPIQNMPLVGNVAGRVIRDSTGESMNRAREDMFSPTVRQALNAAGMRDEQITGARGEIEGLKLTRAELTEYQQNFNELLSASLERYMAHPRWEASSPTAKEQAIRQAATDARAAARGRVVKENKAEMKERARDQRVPAGVR